MEVFTSNIEKVQETEPPFFEVYTKKNICWSQFLKLYLKGDFIKVF